MKNLKFLISLLALGTTGTGIGGYYLSGTGSTTTKVLEVASQNESNSNKENLKNQNEDSSEVEDNNRNDDLIVKQTTPERIDENTDKSVISSVETVKAISIENKDEEKNFTGKLLFSVDDANTNLGRVSYSFYSATLLNNEDYNEKEKSWENEKKETEESGEIYTENISFNISNPINKKDAEAYLKQENNTLKTSVTSQFSGQEIPIKELKKYIESNSENFKNIFGTDFYNDLLSALNKIIFPSGK